MSNFLDQNKDTINSVNSFLQIAQQKLICGPSCQKEKTTTELGQKLQSAIQNLQTAPEQVEEAAKNFYMFSEGEGGYNNYIVQKLTDKGNIIANTLKTNFDNGINKANNLVDVYKSIYLNYIHVLELLIKYTKENIILENKVKNTTADILTNDRKTYYEDQGIDRLKFYQIIFKYIYIVIIISYLICYVFMPSSFTWKIRLFYLFLIIIYPFIIKPVFLFIKKILSVIINILPKNIYKDI